MSEQKIKAILKNDKVKFVTAVIVAAILLSFVQLMREEEKTFYVWNGSRAEWVKFINSRNEKEDFIVNMKSYEDENKFVKVRVSANGDVLEIME